METPKSGRGQPHSTTLRIEWHTLTRDSVMECGCPLPLSHPTLASGRPLIHGLNADLINPSNSAHSRATTPAHIFPAAKASNPIWAASPGIFRPAQLPKLALCVARSADKALELSPQRLLPW